jgi:hypothetical protein
MKRFAHCPAAVVACIGLLCVTLATTATQSFAATKANKANKANKSAKASANGKQQTVSVSLASEKCTNIESDDDGTYSVDRCGKPVAGWQVEVVFADPRDEINLIDAKKKSWPLYINSQGCCFAALGDNPTANFIVRNAEVKGLWFPTSFTEDTDAGQVNQQYYFVARVDTKNVCIVGKFPQTQKTKAIALAEKASTAPCLALR